MKKLPVCLTMGMNFCRERAKFRENFLVGVLIPELCGTVLWINIKKWKEKIFLIENNESNMTEDMLCWLLRNLQAQGILEVINGIVMGKPPFEDKYESYKNVFTKVVSFESNRPELPILYNVNIGHAYPVGIFRLGINYEINCEKKSLKLLESATL